MDNEFKIPSELIDAISELAERGEEGYDSWLKNSVALNFKKTKELLSDPKRVFTMGWIDGYVARGHEIRNLEETQA